MEEIYKLECMADIEEDDTIESYKRKIEKEQRFCHCGGKYEKARVAIKTIDGYRGENWQGEISVKRELVGWAMTKWLSVKGYLSMDYEENLRRLGIYNINGVYVYHGAYVDRHNQKWKSELTSSLGERKWTFDPAYCYKDEMLTLNNNMRNTLRGWIDELFGKPITYYPGMHTSYGLKHYLERAAGFYISNADCKKAMEEAGFKGKPTTEAPMNWEYNVSERKVKKAILMDGFLQKSNRFAYEWMEYV